MLRKIGHITTMCLLLISTTGFAVSEHFCGADLVSIELATEAEDCCNDGMCCHSETDFYQLEEDFIISSSLINLDFDAVFEFPLMFVNLQFNQASKEADRVLYADFESPPPPERNRILSSIQVYLL